MRRKSDIRSYVAKRAQGKFTERYLLVRLAGQIAAQLEELREAQGLSQQQLAERAGTSKAHVNRLLRGDYTGTSLKSIAAVAQALGCNRVEVRLLVSGDRRHAKQRVTPAHVPIESFAN